ncbi:hypothetical protein DIS24_g7514 [Lasiodiplodia hormozganensis]|uniref:F-box domain-containing protein n=1 Tax=Lasiodiplodia hormozganensis TaxID=869390 RepID=A0AA39Y9V5_9PEZI|nr:hypothetical protein DIS24_g7514 [Lasiodiplodia hormozganensis]
MPDQRGRPTLQKSPTSPAPDNGPVDGNMVIVHPSGGSVKGLLDLPAELCLRVFDFLPDQAPADLAALARTCKTLWWPAVRALYKRIILNPKVGRQKCRRKKPASFLRLFHTLLLCDKHFLSMTDEIRIEIKDPTFLCDILLYASADAEEFSELESLGTDISMQISQDMAAAEPADIMLDWREITELILQRSSNLRYIDIFGYTDHTNWNFQLHRYQKLEIVYLHSPRVLTLQGLADLALIPNLKSLQLSSMRDGWHYGPFRFSSIPQAQFPSLVHLKVLGFPDTATYMPDLITMVPMLRSLEIQWVGGDEVVEAFVPYATLSSILSGAHRSTTRPKPRLGETLEKMRVHEIWSRSRLGSMRLMCEERVYEEKSVKMWNERFFGSLKFLRSLKLLEIPVLAPVHRIIHLLPDSVEELHLTDENLFLFDLTEEFERISAVLPHLGPTAGLLNMKAVFLKFRRLDPSPCQHIMDRMKDICREAGIKLNIVLNYVPEKEWGMKEN